MKKLILFFGVTLSAIVLVVAQNGNSSFKHKEMCNPDYVKGEDATKAGNCDETLLYYGNSAGIVSTTGNNDWKALIFVDPDELAFFADSSAFGKIRASIADSLFDGVSMYATYDSVFVEIFEGTTISGTGAGSTMNLGTLIYTKDITAEVVAQGITEHDMDSLIYFNKDTTYAIGIRVFQSDPSPCIGIDVGPSKQGKGAWIYTSAGNSFQRLDYGPTSDNNWVISVCVDGELVVPNNNLTITAATSNLDGYEIMNLNQALVKGYTFSTSVENNGKVMSTGVEAELNIDPVNNSDMVSIADIGPSQTQMGDFPTVFNPFLPGEHFVTYNVTADSADFYQTDNSFTSKTFLIDETRYGRVSVGNITPTPQPGFIEMFKGNMMNMYTEDTLRYIEFFLMDPIVDARILGFCMRWDSAQQEVFGDTLLTDTFTISQEIADHGDTVLNLSFLKHRVLDPGTYIFGLIEMDGADLMLPSNTRNYVPGTSFWTGSLAASGNWINTWQEQEYYYPVIMNFRNTYNTGTEDLDIVGNSIKIYPNPATDIVNISVSGKGFIPTSVQISDLAGRTVGNVQSLNGKKEFAIDMSAYDSGVYFFKFSDGKTSVVRRMVIE